MLPNSEKTRHNYTDWSRPDANAIFARAPIERRGLPRKRKRVIPQIVRERARKEQNRWQSAIYARPATLRNAIGRNATGPKKSIRLYSPPLLTTQHKRPSFPDFRNVRPWGSA